MLTQSVIFDSACILLFGFIGIYLYFTRNFKYWKNRGIKEIPPIPFIGNFGSIVFNKKPFVTTLQEFYKAGEGEPCVGFYVIDKPYLLIRDPELVKNILIKDFNNFTNKNGKSCKSDIIGNMNLFFLKNPDWKHVRNQLSPVFTTGKLKRMLELMLEIDQNFKVYLDSLKLEGISIIINIKNMNVYFITKFTCVAELERNLKI
jgi:cytochrome P450 family 6